MMRWIWTGIFAALAMRFLYLAVTMPTLFIVHIGLLIAAVTMAECGLDEYEKERS